MASLSFFGWGQTASIQKGCGVKMTQTVLQDLQHQPAAIDSRMHQIKETLFNKNGRHQMMDFIPIQAHIIRRDAGTGGLTIQQLNEGIKVVNEKYAPANMQFELCGNINYIDNTSFYNYNESEEDELYYPTQVDDAINIFFANEVISIADIPLCGYAQFPIPGWKNMIIMDNGCVGDGSTFAHELGHYFYLLHTHETVTGKELVDGSNCSTAGDFICDTPADPGLLDNVLRSSCTYSGTAKDLAGSTYSPDVSNLMSYAPPSCTDDFTENQYARIRYWYEQRRQNLLTCEAVSLTSLCNSATNIAFNQPITDNTSNESDNFQVINYQDCFTRNSSDNPFNGQDKIYQFTLSSTTNIEIALTGLSKDLDLFLINDCSNFNCIAASLNSNAANELIQERLSAGTYYLIVDGYIPSEKGIYNLIIKTNDNTPSNSCFIPEGLKVTDKGYSYVKLLWDYSSENSYEQTRIKTEGGDWIYGGFQFGLGSSWAGMTPCTTYEIQINGQCGYGNGAEESDFSPSIFVTTDGCDDAYCYSNGLTYSWNNWIDRVAFNTFNNLSGNDLGYGNFTNVSTTIEKGKVYQINITAGYESFVQSSVGYRVWIDFNQDNDFEDTGEKVVEAYHFNQEILKAAIMIPVSAKSGATRMRITANKDRLPEPCDLGEYSEVEDYTLIIEGETEQAALTVNTSQLSVAANTVTATFSITSNTSWTVSKNDTWIKSITPAAGINNGTINISLDPNTNAASRTAIITIEGTGVSNKTVRITQEGIMGAGSSSQPDWQIISTSTGTNHTLILPNNLQINANCQLKSGDWIGAFFIDNGQEKCAGYGQWVSNQNTSFASYGDDTNTVQKDGFASGEGFLLKAWQSESKQEIVIQGTFAPADNLITHTHTFANNGVSRLASLDCGRTTTTQTISLQTGWNLISSYILPENPDFNAMLANQANQIDIIKNSEGLAVLPAFNINNIGNWNPSEGYQIRVNEPIELTITGTVVDKQASISLKKGWQIIPYWQENPTNVATVFAGITNDINLVKDNKGANFLPAYSINTIGNMIPGQGYWVSAKRNTSLRYQNFRAPPTEASARNKATNKMSTFILGNINTGNNATLILPKTSLPASFLVGGEIGVFSPEGDLYGSAVINGENLAITYWGDDLSTTEKEGFAANEIFEIRHWSKATNQSTVVKIAFEHGGNQYVANAVKVAKSIQQVTKMPLLETTTFNAPILYPNPTTNEVTLSFESNHTAKSVLKIFSTTGKIIYQKEVEIMAGNNSLRIPLFRQPNGVYWVQLRTNENYLKPIKLVIQQ